MIYSIAGLFVEIHGSCQMNKSDVLFVKESFDAPYKRTDLPVPTKRELSPSGEEISPDGISVFKDENEQFSNFCGNEISAVINGCPSNENGESLYVLHRLKNYRTSSVKGVLVPDFSISYKVVPQIFENFEEYLGDLRGFSFYREKTGFCLVKRIKEIDEVLVKISFNEKFTSAEIEIFDVSGLGGLCLEDRIHSYIGEAFAYLALMHGKVVFHSSAVSYNGSGVCFSAPSGTGKSTHTGLWKTHYENKTEIINDDTPVLYVNLENAVLCGSPWSGKTELNINKEVPLKGIVFLERSVNNRIERVRGLDALRRFFGEAKIPQIPVLFDKGMETISKILEKTPVYLLGCNISKDAVDLVKDTLEM